MPRTRVHGTGELRRALAALPAAVDDVARSVLRESGDAIRDDARHRAKHDTGRLAHAIDTDYAADGLSVDVGFLDPTLDYEQYPEFGTSAQPARPTLLPAFEAEKRRIPGRFAAAFARRFG